MKLNVIEKVTFVIAVILFMVSTFILYNNWNETRVTISSFAALEYCGIFILTIYDRLKKN